MKNQEQLERLTHELARSMSAIAVYANNGDERELKCWVSKYKETLNQINELIKEDEQKKEEQKETKIKLTKVEEGGYKCRSTYEWEGHIIEGDDCCFSGGSRYWYCDTLFKGCMFRTLKGLKRAIQLKVDGKLTDWNLRACEEE